MAVGLSELCLHHPLLSILNGEQSIEQNECLHAYILLLVGSHQEVPATMTELYGGYMNYVIQRNTPKIPKTNVDSVALCAKYGQMAFDVQIKKKKATPEVLERNYNLIFPLLNSKEHCKDMTMVEANRSVSLTIPGSYGLLIENETDKKSSIVFRDGLIRTLLAAHFQLSEILRKIRLKRRKLLSSALIESVKQLPASGDLWRLTLGLMSQHVEARGKQRQLLLELLDYSQTLITMSSFDMTSLCIESIYESRFTNSLPSKTLDDFTLNQTINFSHVKIKPHRLNYSIAAIGHLVKTNGSIFGLHLSNFGICEDNIHLLTDPLNVVSDNSLQVLNLSGNELGEHGILKLERFLFKASLLTHLDLSACLLYDAGVMHLSEVLICIQLIYLNLSSNGISDIGMAEVTKRLRFCPALEFLHIGNNRLTDKSAILLGGVMDKLPNLRSLDLRKNEIGEEGVQYISKNTKQLTSMANANKDTKASASQSVWKTKSARLSNFSLRRVPIGGVLKKNQGNARLASDQNAVCHLPKLEEEPDEIEKCRETKQNMLTKKKKVPTATLR